MDWSIQEVARLAGVSSRTLRHYDQIGLLAPSATGAGGLRRYDAAAITRLQRILMLRELGLGLPAIAEVLAGETDDVAALRAHLGWLESERARLARQIRSVRRTIETREAGDEPMAEEMLDGFDHTRHREEVEQRWGAEAYAQGDRWWRQLGDEGRAGFRAEVDALNAAWIAAHEAGVDPAGAEAQALAERHVAWLAAAYQGRAPGDEHLLGLAAMYADDPRFARNYERSPGDGGAAFVRDALAAWVAARR